MDSKKPLAGYFDSLDGLRAISILLVMLNHFTIPLPAYLEFFRARGHLGVEVFFAVSGFLVMRSLHVCYYSEKGQLSRAIKQFYIRRGARIFVPYYLTLMVIFALSTVIGSLKQKISSISDILLSFPFYFYNYAKSFTAGQVPGSLNIMWSLSFEEQFYLFLGLIFVLFRNHLKLALLISCLLSLIIRFITILNDPGITAFEIQMQTHMRLDAILWGCIFYLYHDQLLSLVKKSVVTQFLILAGTLFAFYFGYSHAEQIYNGLGYGLTALWFATLVIYLLARPQSWLAKLLSLTPMVFIGKISYEIYLTHQLVNAIASKAKINSYPLAYIGFMLIGSIAVSAGFYYFISNPSQKYIRKKLS